MCIVARMEDIFLKDCGHLLYVSGFFLLYFSVIKDDVFLQNVEPLLHNIVTV